MITSADAQPPAAATKSDPKQRFRALYQPSAKEPTIVDVPDMLFLMVDGRGNPNTSLDFQQAIQALYGVGYTLKFALKKALNVSYSVMPLEGLFWTPDMRGFLAAEPDSWLWTLMLMEPDEVTPAFFEQAREQVEQKRGSSALQKLRLERFHEGLAAQIMHRGPYAAERPTIERLHAYIREQGYTFDGTRQKHHEIYLSDPGRTAPERMRTVVRQPISRPA